MPIESSNRGMVSVTGRDPEEIGVIARDYGIALTSLVPARYRDAVAGLPTSNFSYGLSVTWQ